ncbi:unnamed protein product, partial [Didymodactylos carnosus]
IAVHCSGNDSLLFQKAPTDKQDYIEFHGEVDDIEDLEDSLQASAVNLVGELWRLFLGISTAVATNTALDLEFVSDVIALTKPRIKEENLETKRVRSDEIGEDLTLSSIVKKARISEPITYSYTPGLDITSFPSSSTTYPTLYNQTTTVSSSDQHSLATMKQRKHKSLPSGRPLQIHELAFDEGVLDDETRTQKQKQKRKQLPASVRVNSLLSRIENVLNPFEKYAKQNIIPYINIADDDDDEK